MSRTRTRRPSARPGAPPRRSRYGAAAGWAAGAVIALVAGLLWSSAGGPPDDAGTGVSMSGQGTAVAGGVAVNGAHVEMGQVPLDVTVLPEWVLTNTTSSPITLGLPHASVVEGCCPGPLTLAADRLGPGESTILSFSLMMHAGMDGPHDFQVHVPVGDADLLTLRVTGDFGG